jgi:tetratricopeptide (TPR) repeat protein
VRVELARAGRVGATKRQEARQEAREAHHNLRNLFAGGAEQAIEHARIAVHHDPTLVEAHTSLAAAYNFLGFFSLMRPRVAFQMARRAAERAMALDERSALAHVELAMVRFGGDWDWEGAETAFRRALELSPELAIARAQYGWLLVLLGRHAAAFAEAERARDLAPTSHLILASCAQAYFLAEEYETCVARCRECLALPLDRSFAFPHPFATYLMGQSLLMVKRPVEARMKLEEAADLGNRMPFYLGLLGRCYGEIGDQAAAAGIIETLNAQSAAGRYVAPHCYVYTYHGLGNPEAALKHQERAYQDGASPLNYLNPFVRDLFSLDPDQRYRLRQMHLTL